MSPPAVLAITKGAILVTPNLVKTFPISLIVAPLSKMSSNKMTDFLKYYPFLGPLPANS
jgi:hypothetical protein